MFDKWQFFQDHFPALAAVVRVPDGVLIKAGEIVIVAGATALVTMYGVQRSMETELRNMKEDIAHIREHLKETNKDVAQHMREAGTAINHVQLQLLEHRLHEEGKGALPGRMP